MDKLTITVERDSDGSYIAKVQDFDCTSTGTVKQRNWKRRIALLDDYDIDPDRCYWVSQYAQMMECGTSVIYRILGSNNSPMVYTKSEIVRRIKQEIGI